MREGVLPRGFICARYYKSAEYTGIPPAAVFGRCSVEEPFSREEDKD